MVCLNGTDKSRGIDREEIPMRYASFMMSLGFMMGITDSRSSRTTSFSFPAFAFAIASSYLLLFTEVRHPGFLPLLQLLKIPS